MLAIASIFFHVPALKRPFRTHYKGFECLWMLREGLLRLNTNMEVCIESMGRKQRGWETEIHVSVLLDLCRNLKTRTITVQAWGQRSVFSFVQAQCHATLTDGHWPSPYKLWWTPEIKMDLGFLTFALCENAPGIHQNDTQKKPRFVYFQCGQRKRLQRAPPPRLCHAYMRCITSRIR